MDRSRSLCSLAFAICAACVSNVAPNPAFPANPPPNPSGEPPNDAVGPEAAGAPTVPTVPEAKAGAPDPGPTVVGHKPASPPSPPIVTDVVPIDPSRPMPADTLGTDAMLALEEPASVMVDGRADVFSSGLTKADAARGGVLPTRLALAPGGGVIRARSIRGQTGCAGGAAVGTDDTGCAGLVGVFLGDRSGRATRGGDASPGAAELAPKLGETFFVGDGLTGTGTGTMQTFKIPKGATKLYLGYVGGSYAHNTGGVSAIVTQHAK